MVIGESSTWLEIDLSAIKNNIRQIQAITRTPVMAVIKANGYGHGLVEVARAAEDAGAAWCGIARIDEALVLRQAGISLPMLVLGFCPPEHVPAAIANNIRLTVFHPEMAHQFAAQARAVGGKLRVHIKVDSGMGRLGLFPCDALPLMQELVGDPNLLVEGVFTHMARADEPSVKTTDQQIAAFQSVVTELEAQGLRPPLVHALNSAGALYFPQGRFDLVRPGIAIYGLHPSPDAPLPPGFRPALAWKTQLVSLKELPPGYGVGYNHRYITRGRERIGVIPVGYADGYRRRLGNFALVRGKRVPAAGQVCMDQCMLQLDSVPDARNGDEVTLIGRQGDAVITAEEVAEAWGTVNYEVVCGLAIRVPRIYL